jgi:hypothetical protein
VGRIQPRSKSFAANTRATAAHRTLLPALACSPVRLRAPISSASFATVCQPSGSSGAHALHQVDYR